MRGWRIILLLLAVGSVLLAPVPTASPGGRGAIIEANPSGGGSMPGSLNPLWCGTRACYRAADFLFPRLLSVDPATGQFTPDGDGLARSWDVSPDGLVYTFHLRDDLAWSDGVPVTAYDVFFSYLAAGSAFDSPYWWRLLSAIAAAAPLDAQTITFAYREATCSALNIVNIPVIPAHVFDPDFVANVAADLGGAADPLARYASWRANLPEGYFRVAASPVFNVLPTVTAGRFQVDRIQPPDYIRLVTADGQLGYSLIALPENRSEVELFLAGETNVIVNPSYEWRDDIRAADGVQIFESPGRTWHYINFNLADPSAPLNAFDEDGQRQDQGYHPIFGDVRVRRAIQQAINVEQLIEGSVLGDATVVPANQLPTSWAYNPTLAPVPYDPVGAAQLLEAAGWKDLNGDGLRECVECLYARPGTLLSFELIYPSNAGTRWIVSASLIAQQLRRVGIQVNTQGSEFESILDRAQAQHYDAFLAGWTESYPFDPDEQTALFSSAEDVVSYGLNTGSYYNPRVDELIAQAGALPGCDTPARAAIYHEIQAILQAEQPYVWLFAPDEMVAARTDITGFAPYPYAPFWNIETWVVTR
jgi:peptide/nickel transport system substrate-binding protein